MSIADRIRRHWRPSSSRDSEEYWERRYREGGFSGPGSRGRLADFKAGVLNGLAASPDVETVMEFGCGDGEQLTLARYPRYLGLDVSPTIVDRCRTRFADDDTKSFALIGDRATWPYEFADLVLSIDVIFHLVEDEIFEDHMRSLVDATEGMLVIYSSNVDAAGRAPHVRHRRFTDWLAANAPHLELVRHVPNPWPAVVGEEDAHHSFCDFWMYRCLPQG